MRQCVRDASLSFGQGRTAFESCANQTVELRILKGTPPTVGCGLRNDADAETTTALAEIDRIAALRLKDILP